MDKWLIENIVWVGISMALFLVVSKILIGRWLKQLMDGSSSPDKVDEGEGTVD